MTQTKYFQKLKCECVDFSGAIHLNCDTCKGSGIIAGADITSTIKPILEGIDKAQIQRELQLLVLEVRSDGYWNALEKAKQIIEENTIKVE